MKRVSIHEANAHLAHHLAELAPGEILTICNNNEPVAELRRLPQPALHRRPWGVDHGVFEVPHDFNSPLGDDELAAWER